MKITAIKPFTEPHGTEATLEFYHRIFRPYFEEYAALTDNAYDITASTDATEIVRAAHEQGLTVSAFPSLPARRLTIDNGTQKVGFAAAQPSAMKPIIDTFCADKLVQKVFYAKNHIPHARGQQVTSLEHAREIRPSIGPSVVLKPSRGRQGLGVTVGIYDDVALKEAWSYARSSRRQSPIMMEETFVGCDLRAVILDKKVVCAYLKIPPNVIGDGRSTVQELVDAKNTRRAVSPALRVAMIPTDKRAQELVRLQGVDMSTVLNKGEAVLLGLTQSVSSGGDLLPINGRLSAPVDKVARSVAEALDYTGPLGMDVLCRDFEEPNGTALICETNPQPALFGALYPPVGRSVDCPKLIVQHYFGKATQKPKAEPFRISCQGARINELQAFAEAVAANNANIMGIQCDDECTISGTATKEEISTLVSKLLDTRHKPKYVDSAYVILPKDAAGTRKTAFNMSKGQTKPLRASDVIKTLCAKEAKAPLVTELDDVVQLNSTSRLTFTSPQVNGWFSCVHANHSGHQRLRHTLAMAGLPVTRKLMFDPGDGRGIKRAVARFGQNCIITLMARTRPQVEQTVSTAAEAEAVLKTHANKNTKTVIVSPTKTCSQVALLVFDNRLLAAYQNTEEGPLRLHPAWQTIASTCMRALPSARLLSIDIEMEDPQMPPDDQEWAVDAIDADPDLAKFGSKFIDPKSTFARQMRRLINELAI
ncbi:hypothetical protein MWU54_11000 [Marivita sp. S6314]|nr:hypothetical protein [Marivita sp. S6314]